MLIPAGEIPEIKVHHHVSANRARRGRAVAGLEHDCCVSQGVVVNKGKIVQRIRAVTGVLQVEQKGPPVLIGMRKVALIVRNAAVIAAAGVNVYSFGYRRSVDNLFACHYSFAHP